MIQMAYISEIYHHGSHKSENEKMATKLCFFVCPDVFPESCKE